MTGITILPRHTCLSGSIAGPLGLLDEWLCPVCYASDLCRAWEWFIAGPTGKDIFELPFVFVETMMLLFSSITLALAWLYRSAKTLRDWKRWIKVTFVLGLAFICMEVYEFHHLIAVAPGLWESAFLHVLYLLAHTAVHVTFGLIWV